MTTSHHRSTIARRTYVAALAVIASVAAACDAAPMEPVQVNPPCVAPAPLQGTFTSQAPGYIVVFDNDVDAGSETSRLAQHYGFTARFVYTVIPGFAADLGASTVAALRCEGSVKYVAYNGVASVN